MLQVTSIAGVFQSSVMPPFPPSQWSPCFFRLLHVDVVLQTSSKAFRSGEGELVPHYASNIFFCTGYSLKFLEKKFT